MNNESVEMFHSFFSSMKSMQHSCSFSQVSPYTVRLEMTNLHSWFCLIIKYLKATCNARADILCPLLHLRPVLSINRPCQNCHLDHRETMNQHLHAPVSDDSLYSNTHPATT